MKHDRSVRRLTDLQRTASSARVLNLLAIHAHCDAAADLRSAPFFANALLDRSIILKHRLRPHEYDYFSSPRPTATKILLPIDGSDLKAGARAVFIGQRDFDQVIQPVLGEELRVGSRDRQVLEIIDALPSLDPFLLRERLRASGVEPARAYFGISEADMQRMFDFVREEIMALVVLSSGEALGAHASAARLVEKLLSSGPGGGFEPLKETLKLTDREYFDGVFSWRGFLYYKWLLTDLTKPMTQVMMEIARVEGRGPRDPIASDYIPDAKRRLQSAMATTAGNVRAMLDIYDRAYGALTRDNEPSGFRDFLLTAPSMFMRLGEQLGAIQHMVSFWRYRFPEGRPRLISPTELMDVLLDFEDGLMSSQDDPRYVWVR